MPLRFVTDALGVSRPQYRMLRMALLAVAAISHAGPLFGMDQLVTVLLGTGMAAKAVFLLATLAGLDALGDLLDVY